MSHDVPVVKRRLAKTECVFEPVIHRLRERQVASKACYALIHAALGTCILVGASSMRISLISVYLSLTQFLR